MASKVLLHVLNGVFTFFGFLLASGSIGYFVYIHMFTSLRNSNHYLLDYNVYWPQAISWIFFVCGLFVMFTSCCGFQGAKRGSKNLITTYWISVAVVVLLLMAMSIIILIFADSERTDRFIKDSVWDAYFQSKENPEIADSFGNIERRLHCCGANSPRDYKNWKDDFPMSCCDVFYHGFLEPYAIDCQITNKLANERHGCSEVASQYARIGIKSLSGVAIFTALIGIFIVLVALSLKKSLRDRRPRQTDVRYDTETKKVLL